MFTESTLPTLKKCLHQIYLYTRTTSNIHFMFTILHQKTNRIIPKRSYFGLSCLGNIGNHCQHSPQYPSNLPVSHTNIRCPFVYHTNIRCQFISHKNIRCPFISHTNVKCPFISHTNTRCPFISHKNIRCPFIFQTNIRCPFISHTNIRYPFVSHRNIKWPFNLTCICLLVVRYL